jgi:hypothetical protein
MIVSVLSTNHHTSGLAPSIIRFSVQWFLRRILDRFTNRFTEFRLHQRFSDSYCSAPSASADCIVR